MSGYVPKPAIPNQPKNYRNEGVEPVDLHAQRWAEYEKHGKEPAPAKEKVKVSLRIGVFFDGTLNNASNSASGLLCGAQHAIKPEDIDASCKPYMADPASSYGSDVTNVFKLYELYPAAKDAESAGAAKQVLRSLYVEGIGTEGGGEDRLSNAASGRGATGVAGKVEQAFSDLKTIIERVIDKNPDSEITSLTFDTFGFSRGAAAARHFANEVVRCKQGPLGDVLHSNSKEFSSSFGSQYNSEIIMGFVGLFDTVPSVAGLTNLGNIQSPVAPGIKLYLDRQYFTDVVHLVARDEHRANFALSSVIPAHSEISLPGVHSDIGGSYLEEADECVLVSPMQALTVTQGTDVQTTSIYLDALRQKAKLVASGWPETMLEIVTPKPTLLPDAEQDRFGAKKLRAYAGLQLKRSVSGKLSVVYLRLMHKMATEKGVQFDDVPDTPQYAVPSELQPLCDKFLAGQYDPTPAEEKLLKLRYIHTSANWNNPIGSSRERGLTVRYTNAPTDDGVRVRHPHVPDSNWRTF
ncbi:MULTISPECIES: phospholipase effector Tle1 domain-containing protein [unclassified Pseudomonas]|uniref:phospholipase effector Tle1 domain-containing protein n=1 Tax=unclassified Pseudomonas TaxID=196821 RepID=UPI002AC935D6|nr:MULTISPECIES: DUF2235 domain-containing protein [unclassified Pseudomonas]MEB0047806.1 DUF2235 domain-containing protein [Pseudomonas sp. Dout3]MEB0098320.1 DUF2235 domain-containing protein [Pseudomonas sp. DC1.2]WPX57108.1 DUF2235 domain-containing protein [Pseudomonas sp. DC1.2]